MFTSVSATVSAILKDGILLRTPPLHQTQGFSYGRTTFLLLSTAGHESDTAQTRLQEYLQSEGFVVQVICVGGTPPW